MNESKHFDYLDSVRGIACLIVVFLHMVSLLYPETTQHGTVLPNTPEYIYGINYPPFNLLVSGRLAVWLFFILSGFVLSYKFIGNQNIIWKIIEASIKRPIRLLGLIYFSLLPILTFLFTSDFWTNRIVIDYDVYINCLYRMACSPISTGFCSNPPMWTISIELVGSFITFGICLIIGSINKNLRLIALISLIILFKNSYYVAFVFGILFADLHKNWVINIKNEYINLISYIILIPAILTGTYQGVLSPSPFYMGEVAFELISSVLIFIFVLMNNNIKFLLKNKILVFIGSISYSIYILHWVILSYGISNIKGFILSQTTNIHIFNITLLIILSVLIITISYVVDKFIDKPCIKFSSWFSKKLMNEIQLNVINILNYLSKIKLVRYCFYMKMSG